MQRRSHAGSRVPAGLRVPACSWLPPEGAWRRVRLLLWVVVLACCLPRLTKAEDLKVATWNLNWLTLRAKPGEGLPPDVKPRVPEDFDRLAAYAEQLDADVVAVQEVDGWDAAARLFPRERYSLHMTRDHVVQRVGIVVRRGLRYDSNPDVTSISTDPGRRLRSGADITLHLPGGDLRVLAVHLKTGCQDKSLQSKRRPCMELREQIEPLQDWIAARGREGVPFVVLGDFNRRMEQPDKFILALNKAAPLVRGTEGRSSPCWGHHEAFIDHILLGGPARRWLVPDSLRVLVYREEGTEWESRLSDHCPVSVRLAAPDAPAAAAPPSSGAHGQAVPPGLPRTGGRSGGSPSNVSLPDFTRPGSLSAGTPLPDASNARSPSKDRNAARAPAPPAYPADRTTTRASFAGAAPSGLSAPARSPSVPAQREDADL